MKKGQGQHTKRVHTTPSTPGKNKAPHPGKSPPWAKKSGDHKSR